MNGFELIAEVRLDLECVPPTNMPFEQMLSRIHLRSDRDCETSFDVLTKLAKDIRSLSLVRAAILKYVPMEVENGMRTPRFWTFFIKLMDGFEIAIQEMVALSMEYQFRQYPRLPDLWPKRHCLICTQIYEPFNLTADEKKTVGYSIHDCAECNGVEFDATGTPCKNKVRFSNHIPKPNDGKLPAAQ